MAYQSIWYFTDIPKDVVDIIEKDLTENFEWQMLESKLYGDAINKDKRNSMNAWVTTAHWSAGFIWHYVQKANRENFLYDLTAIDGETMQFTKYGPGEFYNWHNDAGITLRYKPEANSNVDYDSLTRDFLHTQIETVRKLSFVLQLSDSDEYEGGNLQLLDEGGKSYIAPRKKGTMILFDSRSQHRVMKVRSGIRKSLVGWVVGPRWK